MSFIEPPETSAANYNAAFGNVWTVRMHSANPVFRDTIGLSPDGFRRRCAAIVDAGDDDYRVPDRARTVLEYVRNMQEGSERY